MPTKPALTLMTTTLRAACSTCATQRQLRDRRRRLQAVRALDFHVDAGETLAIVGESGSGKSVSSLALMRLVEHGGGRIDSGEMWLTRRDGERVDLAQADSRRMRACAAPTSRWCSRSR
jgi:ABC-type dipeptide/oligopeptide/nickel transport system ATPase component